MKEIIIPPRRTARWHFLKQAAEPNALNIARFLSRDEASFVLYADMFYAINGTAQQVSINLHSLHAIHDFVAQRMLDEVEQIYGTSTRQQIAKYLFTYNEK